MDQTALRLIEWQMKSINESNKQEEDWTRSFETFLQALISKKKNLLFFEPKKETQKKNQ